MLSCATYALQRFVFVNECFHFAFCLDQFVLQLNLSVPMQRSAQIKRSQGQPKRKINNRKDAKPKQQNSEFCRCCFTSAQVPSIVCFRRVVHRACGAAYNEHTHTGNELQVKAIPPRITKLIRDTNTSKSLQNHHNNNSDNQRKKQLNDKKKCVSRMRTSGRAAAN